MYQESLRAFLKPVLKYLDDPSVSEIMINGPEEIWIEAKGKVILTDAKFTVEGLNGAARNMAQFVGRVLNDERPRLDARLPDGSRIHIVIAPIARKGTTVSIRKFMQGRPGIEKLIEWGSMTPQMAYLIKAMVHTKLNIVVAGGTGSGKTTLLNIVSTLIPNDERILTIEDSAELQLQQDHIVPFESRPADKFGKGEVNMGHLLHSALRLRPDRIVVGEVRGGEAFDLMQAMNTGHGGSMATTHANTPTDTLRRLESLCLMSSVEMPMVAIRAQVASAINAVISCERFHDGSRRTTAIAEVLPLDEKGEYRTQNLFVYAPTHKDEEGYIHGYHSPTGILPTFLAQMNAHGFADIGESFFDPKTYGVPPPPLFMSQNVRTRWAPSLKHRETGHPDSDEIKAEMAKAQEYAIRVERDHKERVKDGTFCQGFDFGQAHAPKASTPEKPPEVKAEEPRTRPESPPEPAQAQPEPPARLALPPSKLGDDSEETAVPARKARDDADDPEKTPPPRNLRPPTQPQGVANRTFNEDTRPPTRAPHPRQTPSRPMPPRASAEPSVMVSADPVLQPAPRPTSGLPPGKRPLPFGARPGPARRPAPPVAPPVEEAEEEGNSDDCTMIREVPDRFRR